MLSTMRGKIAPDQLRRVVGHTTDAMGDRYDHVGIEQLRDVLAVQEKVFE